MAFCLGSGSNQAGVPWSSRRAPFRPASLRWTRRPKMTKARAMRNARMCPASGAEQSVPLTAPPAGRHRETRSSPTRAAVLVPARPKWRTPRWRHQRLVEIEIRRCRVRQIRPSARLLTRVLLAPPRPPPSTSHQTKPYRFRWCHYVDRHRLGTRLSYSTSALARVCKNRARRCSWLGSRPHNPRKRSTLVGPCRSNAPPTVRGRATEWRR